MYQSQSKGSYTCLPSTPPPPPGQPPPNTIHKPHRPHNTTQHNTTCIVTGAHKIILNGKLMVTAGRDGFQCEAGPWTVLAAEAITADYGEYIPGTCVAYGMCVCVCVCVSTPLSLPPPLSVLLTPPPHPSTHTHTPTSTNQTKPHHTDFTATVPPEGEPVRCLQISRGFFRRHFHPHEAADDFEVCGCACVYVSVWWCVCKSLWWWWWLWWCVEWIVV
jgi:hypothetical protein